MTDGNDAPGRRSVTLPDGRTLVVRPAGPTDVDELAALYDGLDDDDRYRRFFSLYRPDRAFFERMATAAARGGYELVAAVSGSGEPARVVGEAGYSPPRDGDGAELAITVARAWRGWLGAFLLDALVEVAAARGVANLCADVLVANRPMLALARSRGYATAGHPDWSIVTVLIGTGGPTPTWPEGQERPRVLVEVPGGRWRAEDEARAAGLDVLVCPGPGPGPARCPALAGKACPLVAGADVVVVLPRPDDERWRALLDAHARVHPGVPVAVDLPALSGTAQLVALVERLARGEGQEAATRSEM